jgi:signal peptidase I
MREDYDEDDPGQVARPDGSGPSVGSPAVTSSTGVSAPASTGTRSAHGRRRSRRRGLMEWVVIVVVALVAAFVIRTYLVESYVVPTGSMEPTIMPYDRILVNKLSFDFGQPHVGEIIVFNKPASDTSTSAPILVKRLIGLPGQTLRSGPAGEIFVDGKLLNQPWLSAADKADGGPAICDPQLDTTDCSGGVLRLPAGEYFMMGDNRGDSDDSRYWGPISAKLFIGRTFARIWPLDRIHWF